MFKSLKIKSIGLGIACLAFSFSGATHASTLDVDGGKYGKHCDTDIKDKDDCKSFDFDLCKVLTLDIDVKGDKDGCDVKDDKCDKDRKDHKDICKIDWKDCRLISFCDFRKDKHDDCDLVIDPCHPAPCHSQPVCDPHAVPAPASAEMSGLGLIGIALMGWVKARRSARA